MIHDLCFSRCLVCFLTLSVDICCWRLCLLFWKVTLAIPESLGTPVMWSPLPPTSVLSSFYFSFVFHILLLTFLHLLAPGFSSVRSHSPASVAFVSVFSSSVSFSSTGFLPPFPKDHLKYDFSILKWCFLWSPGLMDYISFTFSAFTQKYFTIRFLLHDILIFHGYSWSALCQFLLILFSCSSELPTSGEFLRTWRLQRCLFSRGDHPQLCRLSMALHNHPSLSHLSELWLGFCFLVGHVFWLFFILLFLMIQRVAVRPK